MNRFIDKGLAGKLKAEGFPMPTNIVYATYKRDSKFCPMKIVGEAISKDPIAPTIEQVLKWLREKFFIHISTKPYPCEDGIMWMYEIRKFSQYATFILANKTGFAKEEQAALAGIERVIDNFI